MKVRFRTIIFWSTVLALLGALVSPKLVPPDAEFNSIAGEVWLLVGPTLILFVLYWVIITGFASFVFLIDAAISPRRSA